MDKDQIIGVIIQIVKTFFSKNSTPPPAPAPQLETPVLIPKDIDENGIDWNNPNSKVSKYFTVHEALYLPSWKVLHIPSAEEKTNIVIHAKNMDKVRDFLEAPMVVHVWIRPILNNPTSSYHGQNYNAFVKGAANSCHKIGLATDYHAIGMSCDEVRAKLDPKLEEFQMRMEKLPGSTWVHNDSKELLPGGNRFFIP